MMLLALGRNACKLAGDVPPISHAMRRNTDFSSGYMIEEISSERRAHYAVGVCFQLKVREGVSGWRNLAIVVGQNGPFFNDAAIEPHH